MLRVEIFPSIAARGISGYHGAELFVREADDEVESVTVLRFESMAGAVAFAGADASKPVIFRKQSGSSFAWTSGRNITTAIP
jgi:hypothetical protein